MPRKNPPALASYGPGLLEVWRDALTRRVEIPVLTEKDATYLRHRLYSLRAAMKKEKHTYYETSLRVTLTLESREDEWFVIADAADSKFEEALKRAGISNPADKPPSIDDLLNSDDNNITPFKPS